MKISLERNKKKNMKNENAKKNNIGGGYQKIRQGDDIVDEKPLEAIANEAHEGSNEHDKGERKVHESKA